MKTVMRSAVPKSSLSALDQQSGTALRAFFQIARLWSLKPAEQRTLLGNPPESTFFKWKRELQGSISRDVLERISYILGIYKALQILFPDPTRADAWIKKPNSAPLFGDQSALNRMLSGNVADLYVIRQYLDAQRGTKGEVNEELFPPLSWVKWQPAFRLVSSRFPPIGPWDRIAHPNDFDTLAEIEGLTNPRLREEMGRLQTIPKNRRVAGPNTTPIMAAFTHFDSTGSRFSDGTYGVFYAAYALETAIEETKFHRSLFLSRTRVPPMEITMRCYTMDIHSKLHDIRKGFAELYDPNHYITSQKIGRSLRDADSNGLVYWSVRHVGGECVAIFWPDQVGACVQTQHFGYYWDGQRISHVIKKTLVE